ncbi:MAG: hypothetical protein CFH24_00656, partial [Alphaproteobacteria bacterium MarineAlpha6_Bin2]
MLKAGIIGLGHGSRVLIDAFILNNIEVYGIASKNYSNAKKISKEKGISKTYRSWKELVSDIKIDIVAIAVPPHFQIEILKECLNKNKSVFCDETPKFIINRLQRFVDAVKIEIAAQRHLAGAVLGDDVGELHA